ncbi:hypothetical protein V7152_28670 [Neobacillus drentensis]
MNNNTAYIDQYGYIFLVFGGVWLGLNILLLETLRLLKDMNPMLIRQAG